jgi:hypothetical protein
MFPVIAELAVGQRLQKGASKRAKGARAKPPVLKSLLACDLRWRGVENTGTRNLGGDQKGRNYSRDTDKSQELVK